MRRGPALLLLCLLTFVVALGGSAITDSDEAYYAEAGREMVVSGDWITPHYNFEPRLQKPVLYYWFIAATYSVAGITESNARLWSALAGLGIALVAAAVGRRWYGGAAGTLAGTIVATSFGVVLFARQSLPDMPLAFFVSVSIWAALEALRPAGEVAGTDRRTGTAAAWLTTSAASAALGMLDKGPVAVVLPVTVLAPLVLWRVRRGDRRWPEALRATPVALAAVVFLVIAAPWYLAVMKVQGIEYARQFFIGENVDRFATSTYNAWRGWMYGPVIVAGLLPWSAFLTLWVPSIRDVLARRRRLTEKEMRLVCWAAGTLAFFMASVGSQPRYILPCLVPIAILLARSIATRAATAAPSAVDGFRAAALGAAVIMLLLDGLLWRAANVFATAGADVSVGGPVLMGLAGLAALAGSWRAPRRHLPALIAAAAGVSLLIFATTLLSPPRPEAVETIAAVVRAQPAETRVCSCGAFARSLVFYARRPVIIANVTPEDPSELLGAFETPGVTVAAVDARTLAALERDGRRYPRLAEASYLNLSVWQRGETLLQPDPASVQRVVLIANR